MRMVCKKWRDELDACTYLLAPGVCNAQKIVQRFSHVHELDLSSCTLTVNDECLETLAGMEKLQSIDLRGCVKVNLAPHSTARDPQRLSFVHGSSSCQCRALKRGRLFCR